MSGRKNKLNKDVIEIVQFNLKLGMPVKHTAHLAGISEQTYYKYLSDSHVAEAKITKDPECDISEHESLLIEFSRAVKKGRADAIQRNLANLQYHSKKTWQASAWFLERADPDNFGRRIAVEGNPEKPVHFKNPDLKQAVKDVIDYLDNVELPE